MSTGLLESDTLFDTDIFESLVFEPELSCEHRNHQKADQAWAHSDEGGRYQVIGHNRPCACNEPGEGEMILCQKFVDTCRNIGMQCLECGETYSFWRRYTILERIK